MGASESGPEIHIRLWPVARAMGPLGGLTLAVAGLFVDSLVGASRLVVVAVGIVLVGLGWIGSSRIAAHAKRLIADRESVELRLNELRAKGATLGSDVVLRALARPLFKGGGGWRLSVYFVIEEGGRKWLVRTARVSSLPMWEKSGRSRIPVESSFFRRMEYADLTSPTSPYFEESGDLPDPAAAPDDWYDMQEQVVGDASVVRGLTMRSRKYAWCAAREEDGERRIVALMAESTTASGVSVDVLKSQLMRPILLLMAKAADAPEALTEALSLSSLASGADER